MKPKTKKRINRELHQERVEKNKAARVKNTRGERTASAAGRERSGSAGSGRRTRNSKTDKVRQPKSQTKK